MRFRSVLQEPGLGLAGSGWGFGESPKCHMTTGAGWRSICCPPGSHLSGICACPPPLRFLCLLRIRTGVSPSALSPCASYFTFGRHARALARAVSGHVAALSERGRVAMQGVLPPLSPDRAADGQAGCATKAEARARPLETGRSGAGGVVRRRAGGPLATRPALRGGRIRPRSRAPRARLARR